MVLFVRAYCLIQQARQQTGIKRHLHSWSVCFVHVVYISCSYERPWGHSVSDMGRYWDKLFYGFAAVDIIGAVILTAYVRPVTWFQWPGLSEGTDQGGSTSGPVYLHLLVISSLTLLHLLPLA